MGTYKLGILGGFSGKVGTVVGGYWHGIPYMRGLPTHVSNPNTPMQQLCRTQFATYSKLFSILHPFIHYTWASAAPKNTTAFNAALNYHLKNNASQRDGGAYINLSGLVLSEGKHKEVKAGATLFLRGSNYNVVRIKWTIPEAPSPYASDLISAIVYNSKLKQCAYSLWGTTRATGQIEVQMPSDWVKNDCKAWICACDPNKKQFSRSSMVANMGNGTL